MAKLILRHLVSEHGEIVGRQLSYGSGHSSYEPSDIRIWKVLRDSRRALREQGFSGRLKNFYNGHTETKYARRPAWPIYIQTHQPKYKGAKVTAWAIVLYYVVVVLVCVGLYLLLG